LFQSGQRAKINAFGQIASVYHSIKGNLVVSALKKTDTLLLLTLKRVLASRLWKQV